MGNDSAQVPSIRILFYADSSSTNLIGVPPGIRMRRQPQEFGLRILKDILETSVIPQISVDFLNRFWEIESNPLASDFGFVKPQVRRATPERLTSQRLQNYDEVWFFGQHLGSFQNSPYAGQDFDGYLESELSPQELEDLAIWMNAGGGVLILGDHSNVPTAPDPSGRLTGKLLNLGRAMGHQIIRASEMRVWDGPPGAYLYEGQVNTSGDTDMSLMLRQEDKTPQNVYPVYWDRISPWGMASRQWHPLFAGRPRSGNPLGIIRVFPDHGHDGALNLPTSLNSVVWPKGGLGNSFQPKPTIVAYGTDANTGNRVGQVSAYDGHSVNVGRIVAHSTFHHFVNVNLCGFLQPDGRPDETLQIMTDYFINLASYLMPKRLRQSGLRHGLQRLATSAIIHDLHRAPLPLLGHAAHQVLSEFSTPGQIEDLLNLAAEDCFGPIDPHFTAQMAIPSVPYLLGAMVAEYQAVCCRQGTGSLLPPERWSSIGVKGVQRALETFLGELRSEVTRAEIQSRWCEGLAKDRPKAH